jgi:hypothetical protein
MKKNILFAAVFSLVVLGFWSCTRNNSTSPSNQTPTSSGSQTITVTTGGNSSAANGYSYFVSGITNNPDQSLSLTAHVGDTIIIPSSQGFHPLYFDNGSVTCIFTAATNSASAVTYTFPTTGSYYFHCGNHAATCGPPLGACGYTNCTAMAGKIKVN